MMLNAWHLPVPPFVKQSKDQLLITLWLTGEDPPQRIMLRTEHDNEETSVAMHKQRSQPQPGVTAWRAAIDLSRLNPVSSLMPAMAMVLLASGAVVSTVTIWLAVAPIFPAVSITRT